MQVLYNNPSLQGKLYFKDKSNGSSVRLEEHGVFPPWSEVSTSYDQTILFSYIRETGQVQIIENLATELALPFSNPIDYSPNNRILPLHIEADAKYRY